MSDSAASGSLDLGTVVPGVRATKADPAPIDSEAFRQGDPECFEMVLDRFGPLIWSVVNAYADDRDDLYQEVCVRLLTRREHYREWEPWKDGSPRWRGAFAETGAMHGRRASRRSSGIPSWIHRSRNPMTCLTTLHACSKARRFWNAWSGPSRPFRVVRPRRGVSSTSRDTAPTTRRS